MYMKILMSLGLCSILISGVASAKTTCPNNPELMQATYRITETLANVPEKHKHASKKDNANKPQKRARTLILTRRNNSVAIGYPNLGVTEQWYKLRKGGATLTRFFTRYKRGISYEPVELGGLGTETQWSGKYQLISDDLLARMKTVSESGKDCNRVKMLQHQVKNMQASLTWNHHAKLMERYQVTVDLPTGGTQTTQWELVSTSYDPKIVDQYFDTLGGYDTTDYADVGDMENDPFLAKMINQGFVEHGASGFYDSKGNPMHGGHAH